MLHAFHGCYDATPRIDPRDGQWRFFRDIRRVYQTESLRNERLVAVVCDQETSGVSLEKNTLFEIRFNRGNLIVTI